MACYGNLIDRRPHHPWNCGTRRALNRPAWGCIRVGIGNLVRGVYIYASSRYLSRAGPWVTTAWISFGAMVSFSIMGALTNTLDYHLSTQALMIVLVMIFASTILALGAFLAGVERVGPTTASLLSTLEPVFTIILAVILLGESLSGGQLFGGVLILAAVLLLTIPDKHHKSET
jgi:drug/metabolite transporter (DMT)-like permease